MHRVFVTAEKGRLTGAFRVIRLRFRASGEEGRQAFAQLRDRQNEGEPLQRYGQKATFCLLVITLRQEMPTNRQETWLVRHPRPR